MGTYDILIYTRWAYVKNQETGEVVKKGAYHHLSTEQGAEEIRRYFTANGYKCLVTDDPSVFTSDVMRSLKCIVLASTNHELFSSDAEREAFYDFVGNGGGLLAIHSASANERGSKRYLDFLGGAFVFHYTTHMPVPFTLSDRTHPALDCMPADYVWADDEIYVHEISPGSRVLLEFDVAPLPENEKDRARKAGYFPSNGRHVLEWCRSYGKGRIYYTALGHNPSDFGKMEFQLHLLKAAEWAMGKLPDSVECGVGYLARKTIDGCELVKDGKTVIWHFAIANRESKPFVHPLTLPDGRVITNARPADHPWHLGLWFCFKFINGLNYWEPRDPAADNLFPDGMTVVKDFEITPHGGACDVKLDLWYGPRAEPGTVLVEEKREVSFAEPDPNGCYKIRSRHMFTARQHVKFDCRRPIGYGWFSLRLASIASGFSASGIGGVPDETTNIAGPKGMTAVSYTDPANGHGIEIRTIKTLPTERYYSWSDHRFTTPMPIYDGPLELDAGESIELEYEVSVF